jgi:glycosyltransferase involved in cell wall biosynthesis
MKVLFVAPKLKGGGAERQWSILLPGLKRKGFDVMLLTLHDRGRLYDQVARSVETRFAGMSSRFDVQGLRRALATSSWKPELIVSFGVSSHVIAALIARKTGAAHLLAEHGSMGAPSPRLKLYRRLLIKLVARTGAGAVAVSEVQIPTIVKEGGFRKESIRVVPNGVPEPHPEHSRESVRRSLGVGDDDFVVLLAATLRPVKRVDVFVEALLSAHEREPRIHGLVAGAGPELARIEALARVPNEALQLLGHRTDVDDLLEAADVVCLSSEAEIMPMVVLEAMAMGKPVVATQISALPDLVADGESGYLVPRGDPSALAGVLVDLSREPERAERLGKVGRSRYLERFTAERMIDSYANLLSDTAESRRAAQR